MLARSLEILLDHCRRVCVASAGFKVLGRRWCSPFLGYSFSPILNRFAAGHTARFPGFNARLGEGDLYTFANLFEDYPVKQIREALRDVDLVVDLGANVGAFSYLVLELCRDKGSAPRIIAVEPNAANTLFLRAQPFSDSITIHHAAVGPENGVARLVRGQNSVTDHVDFSGTAEGDDVAVLSLHSLCDRPALVKMDIEGGEHEILKRGLPDNVRHLMLEWHSKPGEPVSLQPADLVPGDWTLISRDIHGSSMWYFRAP